MVDYRLVDTHCHLYLEEFKDELPAYMQRAHEEGVEQIFMPSIDCDHFFSMVAVESKYPGICHSMVGLHPCYVKEDFLEQIDFMSGQLEKRTFAAVGEIGLDYYWDRAFSLQQMEAFRAQIALARKWNLPIVIHSRSSMEDVVAVLKEESKAGVSGIFHCFSGTYNDALAVVDAGLLLGIGGVVTYKNAGLAEVVARIDLEHIVLETDAPYLAPAPFRGKRNESSYLKYIVEKIAQVKNVTVEDVAHITTANAKKVFG